MSVDELFWLLMIGGITYSCSKMTSAQVWEEIKAYLLLTVIFGALFIGGFWLLLFMAS